MFTVRYDPFERILYLTMTGFWTLETVKEFAAAIQETIDRIPGITKQFDVLSESVDMPVQSQEVSIALAQITADFQRQGQGRRFALAVKHMLNKMQVDRTLAAPTVKAFLSVDEAKQWLKSPE